VSAVGHDQTLLGAYVLGALDPYEARVVESHLAGCAECRWELNELAAVRNVLKDVPPEAFLDGPPEGGDMLLQRTLRQARAESGEVPRPGPTHARRARRRPLPVAASLILLAAAAMSGGVVVGRMTADSPENPPVAAPPPVELPGQVPGVRSGAGTDPVTGATMSVQVTPAAGWVRVRAQVSGVKPGEKCLLRVVPKNGNPMTAGSWLSSDKGEGAGVVLDGAALVDPSQVSSVDVVTTDGKPVVSVDV
jgi:hypothetical protein